MSKITIRVCGTSGAGKTTVAEILMQFLTVNNFNATHVPQEDLDPFSMAKSRNARFESIRENCEIEVIETQILRDGSLGV